MIGTTIAPGQDRELLMRLCEHGAKWDRNLGKDSSNYADSFEKWSNELVAKHSKMPNIVEVLKCVTQFVNDPQRLRLGSSDAQTLQHAISKLVAPGVISPTQQPHRVLVVLGVALRQLCFAYNLVPPVELPSIRNVLCSDRSPLPVSMPFVDARQHFQLVMGHDAARPLVEHEVLGLPARPVRFTPAVIDADWTLEPHVLVVPGVVWEQPSHWSRVLKLINDAAAGCATRLVVLLGGYECPFGFVRAMTTSVVGGAGRMNLPDDMDCVGSPIAVPVGVWCACSVEVASFSNAAVVYSLKPTDRVLVINALQVLPCILEHLVTAGRVAHVCLALGAMPPDSLRFAPLSKIAVFLLSQAVAAFGQESCSRQCDVSRVSQARGVSRDAKVFAQLGGTLFTRSSVRLDCATYTTQLTHEAPVYATPTTLSISGTLGLSCPLADLLFLPRIVHPCPHHKCAVLVDTLNRGQTQWIDSTWGDVPCFFAQTAGCERYADQSINGLTPQFPWMDCIQDVTSAPETKNTKT